MRSIAAIIFSIFCILMNLFSTHEPREPERAVSEPPVVEQKPTEEELYRRRLSEECGELFSRYPDKDGWLEEFIGTDIPFLADADYIDRGIKEGFTAGNTMELASFCWYVNTVDSADLTITADIDLSGLEWAPFGWSGGTEEKRHPFCGVVSGGGHTIKGLTMDTDGYYGGFIGWGVGAGVYNLSFTGALIKCRCMGAVCSAEAIGGVFSNVSAVDSSVECPLRAGSLIGWDADAHKYGCTAEVLVNGESFPYLSYSEGEKARIVIDEPFVVSMDGDNIVRRTGGRGDYVNLCWNVYRNGEKFRYEGASGSAEYDCGFIFEYRLEGEYTVWLTAFVDGQYVPVSNTIAFSVEG